MVRLNASQSETTICVPTLEDTTYEGDETFSIQLSAVDVLSYLEDGEASLSSPTSLGAQGRLVVGGVGVSMVTITDNDCELSAGFGMYILCAIRKALCRHEPCEIVINIH